MNLFSDFHCTYFAMFMEISYFLLGVLFLWFYLSIFRLLSLADGVTANNLTEMLMGSLELKGRLNKNGIASKLLCFGADGCSAFQGRKNRITE
jgi:hypothetical protein